MNLSDTNIERAISTPARRKPSKRLPHDAVTIQLITKDSRDRHALEARIAARFARTYGARIEAFLPYLVNLGIDGRHGAVVGLRPASEAPLFLEQYFEAPIEQAISLAFHTPVSRDQVVEVGNLAAAAPGAVALLFGILAAILHEAGMRWVVCTATPRVRSILDDLQLPSRTLRAADPAVLGAKQADWGSYYTHRPHVIAGDAGIAAARMATDPLLAELLDRLRASAARIVTALRAAG